MQILKDEVREEIEKAATAEFIAKGFERASMQNIAGRSGVSTSNIYNYFESKEKLFYTLVDPVYFQINQLMQSFITYETEKSFTDSSFIEGFIQTIASGTGEFIKENRLRLRLIFDKSQGTKYEQFKEDLIGLFEQHLKNGLKDNQLNESTSFIMHICATNLIEGLLEIVRHYKSDVWVEHSVNNLIKYHICGLAQFFD